MNQIDTHVQKYIERAKDIFSWHELVESRTSRLTTKGRFKYYGLIVKIAEMIQKEELALKKGG